MLIKIICLIAIALIGIGGWKLFWLKVDKSVEENVKEARGRDRRQEISEDPAPEETYKLKKMKALVFVAAGITILWAVYLRP